MRMEKHVTVLGALFLGLGGLGAIGMLVVLVIFGLGSGILLQFSAQAPDIPELLTWLPAAFGVLITSVIALTTIPCFFAGYGLLKRRPWGKIAALVAGILNIVAFPLGTGVGIYAIWVFVQEETDQVLRC
jgi:uncharacterized BrkB/YihY/UPF0761 family membrane protein